MTDGMRRTARPAVTAVEPSPGALSSGTFSSGTPSPAAPSPVTPRQLAYWRRSGLVRPGRGELTQARAVAALRRAGLSPRQIRLAAERLCLLAGPDPTATPDPTAGPGQVAGGTPPVPVGPPRGWPAGGSGAPTRDSGAWAGVLRFAVYGRELFVQRAGGAWEGDRAPGQLILDGIVPLVVVEAVAVGSLPGGIPPSSPDPATAPRPARTAPRARPAGASGRDDIRLFLDRQRVLDRRED